MVIMFLIISRLKLTKMIHIVSIEIVLCFGGKSQQTPNLRSGVCSIQFIIRSIWHTYDADSASVPEGRTESA